MFHGVKKSDVHKLTPEEEKENQVRLEKLKVIQTQILKIKQELKYDQKKLDFLLKASMLMPDYPTIWSIRKILIEQKLKELKPQEIFEFMCKEIKSILPIMVKNPKCYLLWYHRIWCIIKGIEIEVQNKTSLEKSIVNEEINLCNKFFLKDDRNFHCWNYRVNILSLISVYFTDTFNKFIESELKFTLEKITLNFSNFSAWHYRAKIIPIYFVQNKIKWNSEQALEFFKDDLELIKKAIYTDPKDQSPWNYYSWVIDNFSPIYVKEININEDDTVNIIYSNVFNIKNLLEINGNNKAYNLLENDQNLRSDFSDTLNIKINKDDLIDNDKLIITNKVIDKVNIGFDGLNLVTNKICFTKENLELPSIEIFKKDGKIFTNIDMKNLHEFQDKFLLNCIDVINELIQKSTDYFIENGHTRLTDLYYNLYQLNRLRPGKEKETSEFKEKLIKELDILKSSSKRMSNLYSTLYDLIVNKNAVHY